MTRLLPVPTERARETISRLLSRWRQPKVWALKDEWSETWTMVVTFRKPLGELYSSVVGPFRSEVDCEDFCDRRNMVAANGMVKFYSPQPKPMASQT